MAPARGDVLAIEGCAGRCPEGDAEEDEHRTDPEHRRGLEDVAPVDAGVEHRGDVGVALMSGISMGRPLFKQKRAQRGRHPVFLPGSAYAWLSTSATGEGLARGRACWAAGQTGESAHPGERVSAKEVESTTMNSHQGCLLYTSDAADDLLCV